MSSAPRSDRPSSTSRPSDASRPSSRPDASAKDAGQHPPREEPEFVNERDLPTEGEPRQEALGNRAPPKADVAGAESAAGEEDPGAALDTLPTPRSPA